MAGPLIKPLLSGARVSAVQYHCRHERHDPSFAEMHRSHTLVFVRKGSFGYFTEGRAHELVAGSVMLGRAGVDYRCTHDHVIGDVCISFQLSPVLLDELAGPKLAWLWSTAALPPNEKIMVLGALAAACADGKSDHALDELGLILASRVIETISGKKPTEGNAAVKAPAHVDRRRAVRAAEKIEAEHATELDLETLAADAGLSAFHFLRVFSRVLGVTPHQYLLRSRLAEAARMLASDDRPITDVAMDVGFGDVSSFVRTFHRAAGCSPRAFRKTARFSK